MWVSESILENCQGRNPSNHGDQSFSKDCRGWISTVFTFWQEILNFLHDILIMWDTGFWIFRSCKPYSSRLKHQADLKYFTLCVLNLQKMKVLLCEVNYKRKKMSFSHNIQIFLRCTCITLFSSATDHLCRCAAHPQTGRLQGPVGPEAAYQWTEALQDPELQHHKFRIITKPSFKTDGRILESQFICMMSTIL